MKKITYHFLTSLLLASSTLAYAGVITTGSTASNVNHTIDFERTQFFATGETLTNQFAAQGATFSASAGQAPVVFNTSGACNPGGLSGQGYAAIGVTETCGVAWSDKTIASILFNSDVEELSFTYVTNNTSNFTFEALLDGVVVSSRAVSNSLNPSNTTFRFSGSNFDTIRFTELGNGEEWFWIDNMSWRSVPSATADVPEPATLALLGFGLVSIAVARRRRFKAA